MNNMKQQNKKIVWLVTLILVFLFELLILLNLVNNRLLWDENVYLGNARSHLGISNFTEDFRFPLIEYIISIAWRITGENLVIAKLIMMLFTVLTLLISFLIMQEYFKKDAIKIKIMMLLSLALSPLILIWGWRVYPDILTLFFITLSFYLFIKSEKYFENEIKSNIFLILCAASCGFAFLSRFNALLFPVAIGLYLVYKKEYKKIFYFILIFILTITPWMIYNYLNYHDILWDLKAYSAGVSLWTTWEPMSKQLMNLVINTGIISIFFILGLYYCFIELKDKTKRNAKNLILFLYVLISLVYYFFFVKLKDARYYLMMLPFIYLLAGKAYGKLDSLLKNKKAVKVFISIALIINLLILTIFGLGYASKERYCQGNAIEETIADLSDKNITNTTIISNFWPYLGYALNVKVASPWNENLTELFGAYDNQVKYIAYSNRIGNEFNKTILDLDFRLKVIKQFEDKCNIISIYEVK